MSPVPTHPAYSEESTIEDLLDTIVSQVDQAVEMAWISAGPQEWPLLEDTLELLHLLREKVTATLPEVDFNNER